MTETSGEFDKRRREQTRDWLHSLVNERLRDTFYRAEVIEKILPDIERKVMAGKLPAVQAARELLKTFKNFLIERWTDNSKV